MPSMQLAHYLNFFIKLVETAEVKVAVTNKKAIRA